MSNNAAEVLIVLLIVICVFLFGGEPDLHDALIHHFLNIPFSPD